MDNKYGILVNPDTKLHRNAFKEMVKLLGVNVVYKYPHKSKHYTLNGELKASLYSEGEVVGCIFAEHPDHQTAKKLGWDAELLENASVIHVPYDLPNLQVGCLFEVPSAFDDTKSRLFRVTKLSAKMIYPASISCEIVPEYEDISENSDIELFMNTDFNVLHEG